MSIGPAGRAGVALLPVVAALLLVASASGTPAAAPAPTTSTIAARVGTTSPMPDNTSVPGPTTSTTPQPPSAREASCTGIQLRLVDDGSSYAATEDAAVLLSLSNVSATGCQLDGYPRVTLIGSSGAPFNVTVQDGHGMVINSKPPEPVRIAPGAAAYLLVEKRSCLARTTATAHTVAVALPGTSQRLETALDFEICTAGDPIPNVINVSPVVSSPAAALNG